jgi:hypothetical protein
MGLFSFLIGERKVKGHIGYFGLADWWLSSFSDHERRYIQGRYQPLGLSGNSLTSGDLSCSSQSVVRFLCGLAGWFGKPGDRRIACRILAKAEELSANEEHALDRHFLYGEKLSLYYKDREDPAFLDKAIQACKEQISVADRAARAFHAEYKGQALPGHKGYQQLAIILEKQNQFNEAITLCSRAAEQGWAGDWEKRIGRLQKKRKST